MPDVAHVPLDWCSVVFNKSAILVSQYQYYSIIFTSSLKSYPATRQSSLYFLFPSFYSIILIVILIEPSRENMKRPPLRWQGDGADLYFYKIVKYLYHSALCDPERTTFVSTRRA